MPLPKRPSTYVLALLLIILGGLAWWLARATALLVELPPTRAKPAETSPTP